MSLKKVVNTDIYNLSKIVDDVKKDYMIEETEDTLNIGIYGAIGAIESKRLQTQVALTGELSNEAFPSRARLERNIVTYAITYNIEDINAVPAKMNVRLGLREKDIIPHIKDNTFIIDRDSLIHIDKFEYHLDYDIILKKIQLANNEQVYTAQYDMSRINPASKITNPYLNAPAVVKMQSDTYLFLNVDISQVSYNVENKKLVTSNIIDNKTITFSFENQLAYFEVHVTQNSGDIDIYLTPLFEGAGIPPETVFYCWYQYIDTNTVRIRFDRNSFMPGLNANVDVLYKTTTGEGGNFIYTKNSTSNLVSKKYKYNNISMLITPLSRSDNGKNRKSKNELQSLLPKEALSRGSLTTIKDLNNFFGMLDSANGRMVVQKKIDNQIERIYYTYLLLKDIYNNVVPTNTIDLKIPISEMKKTEIVDSESPRYILKSGTCIELKDGIGVIRKDPINNIKLSWNNINIPNDTEIVLSYSVRISDPIYKQLRVSSACNTTLGSSINIPDDGDIYTYEHQSIEYRELDHTQNNRVISGEYISFQFTCKVKTERLSVEFHHQGLEIQNISYNIDGITKEVQNSDITESIDSSTKYPVVSFNTTKDAAHTDKQFWVKIKARVIHSIKLYTENKIIIKDENSSNVLSSNIPLYGIEFTCKNNPTTPTLNSPIDFEIRYKTLPNEITGSLSISSNLSRGLTYIPLSGRIKYSSYNIQLEPLQSSLSDDIGFLYTNPYNIVVNNHHLYSTFYMMYVKSFPYVFFEKVNQKSPVQFISNNISWSRPFLGDKKDTYTIKMEISQSILNDFGIIYEDPHNANKKLANVKIIALFYRDKVPYRYRELKLTAMNLSLFKYSFTADFHSLDVLDNDNNIKVEDMTLLNQTDNEYGYFNPNTSVHLYTLVKIPDTEGGFNRFDLDTFVPGLDGWSVTNIFEVIGGVNFYYNFSDIMSSRIRPYGQTIKNRMTPEGYMIKSVPVFGYDYSQDETLVDLAMSSLQDRRIYIESAVEKLENSFGIDFKLFNTYGPSKTFYIIRDTNNNMILDDTKEYINRVNISLDFRVKLISQYDTYTKDVIVSQIKEYIENLNNFNDIHIPTLITQITNNFRESITYIEFLGFNNYGPSIQHLYREEDKKIDIHTAPEFICVDTFKNIDNTTKPNINIYLSN